MFISVVLSILVLTSLIGNSLVIVTVLINKPLQSTLNYLLVNLAVADMFFATFIFSTFALMTLINHPDGTTGRFLCTFVTGGPTAWIGGAVSVLCLMYISVERYCAIIHPLRQRGRLTRRRLKVFVIFAWILAILINIPAYLGHVRYYDPALQRCVKKQKTSWIAKVNSLLWFVAAGLVPVSIMVYMYSRVVGRLWFKSTESKQASQKAALRHRKRVTITVIIVSVIYAVCWIPDLTSFLITSWGAAHQRSWLEQISVALLTFNACVNPVLYSIQMKKFRDHLRDTLLCKKRERVRGQVPCDTLDRRNTTGDTLKGSAVTSATAIPTAAPLSFSSESNTETVATKTFLHAAITGKVPLGISGATTNTGQVNMSTTTEITENEEIIGNAVSVQATSANEEGDSILSAIGTLTEKEGTLRAKLNSMKTEEASKSRATSTYPVQGIHELQ